MSLVVNVYVDTDRERGDYARCPDCETPLQFLDARACECVECTRPFTAGPTNQDFDPVHVFTVRR